MLAVVLVERCKMIGREDKYSRAGQAPRSPAILQVLIFIEDFRIVGPNFSKSEVSISKLFALRGEEMQLEDVERRTSSFTKHMFQESALVPKAGNMHSASAITW